MKINIKAGQIGQVINAEEATVGGPQLPQEQAVPPASGNTPAPTATRTQPHLAAVRRDVFISYSHKDEAWARRLKEMLAPVDLKGGRVWWDGDIQPGDRWKAEIDTALASTRIALLLVSRSFFSSTFISNDELPPLLDAADRKDVRLFWVLLENCAYKTHRLNQYQAAHDVSCPLGELGEKEQNRALVCIVEKLAASLASP